MIVSFQGGQLSAGQRRQLEFQRSAQAAFLNSVLAETVAKTIEVLDKREEQGLKPERVWFPERQETGTLCIAEWMGY